MKPGFLMLFFILFISVGFAQTRTIQEINNFTVKENLLKNNKIAIIATDSLNTPKENLNGIFTFSLNGFKQELKFNDGVAVCPLQIEKSSFVYIKHQNENGTHASLYYISKNDDGLSPHKISWFLMLLIPLGLVLIAYLFRKLIIFIAVLFIVWLYFNYSKGLSVPTFFETIFDGFKSFF